eukprot:gene22205-28319_t
MIQRIKLKKPDSPFFDISAPRNLNGEPLQQSKIASGMEICFVLSFKPQEVRDYAWELECETERETFIVPIRAVGLRPILSLPDDIDFGCCPIKSQSQKKLQVQNTGTSVAKFTMRSSHHEFTCPAQDISIEPGASAPIELYFTPGSVHPMSGEIEVEFSKGGVRCYISVAGVGKNVEVSLSTPSLTLEPSYISLLSQKTLRIRNLSDAPISYMWKSFSNVDEEEEERDRLLSEINRMDDLEHAVLHQRIGEGFYNPGGRYSRMSQQRRSSSNNIDPDLPEDFNPDGTSLYDSSFHQQRQQEMESIPFDARADAACLVRKYRNLRKALEKDAMQFVDDIFEISPIEGQVWAHSEIEITVCFRPDTAAQYNCLAFLDVSGRHDRLALQLTGQGIGPHAALSFDVLDLGDVFINDEQHYEIAIKNKGDIPASWTFMSSLTRFGNKFRFSPKEGHLLPNQTQSIQIRFESDVLGEFSEQFRFALQGNEDMLLCQIKGHVIGPTFHFDCNSIDFGVVSFDYLHAQTLRLINTSRIPMVFSLGIPQDGTYLKKEFNIEPNQGTVGPQEEVEVVVEFIPSTVKTFDYSLAVNVLGVGDQLLSIPVTAQCVVSSVSLEMREIDFGDCFIRYPYERELRLTNLSSEVHTKFEILPQPKQTRSVATYETDPQVAVIEPSGTVVVKIRLVAQKLGPFKVPMILTVAGSLEPPIQAVLSFNTVGPKIIVGSTELRWGNIECLKDSPRSLTITNSGLITASMKVFLKMARSCYRIEVRELVLEAQQSYDLEIIANLDDSVLNKDEAHLVVEEGDNLMVPLVAKGIGTTMYCRSDVQLLDLGVQLTNTIFERQIVLENKGRRPQQLRWFNRTLKEENLVRAGKAKKLGKDTSSGQRLPRHLMPGEPTFTVTPEEITLRPRTATTFTFKGSSSVPKQASEFFVLESKVGKDRYMKQIIETEVRAAVVNPLLQFSMNSISYLYTWQRGVDAVVQKQELTLTNASAVALTFVLKTEMPFNLSSWEQSLLPGQSVEIEVEFDPQYRDDQISHIVDKALVVNYRGHPQRDSIPLRGEVIFPNLKFDVETIHFGCVLNDTLKTLKVRLTNTCKIDLNYEWIYLETVNPKAKAARGSVVAMPPNTNVFDILPVRSMLAAGSNEDVEFSMFGTANNKFHGTVLCVVEGGPEYKFPISGEASTVAFELNRSVVDFGRVVFTEKCDEELLVTNLGKVAFNFEVSPVGASGAQVLELIPPSGKVLAGHSFKVVVRMRPAYPSLLCEQLSIRVAHFDAVTLSCYCQGIFPTAVVSLPRYRKMGPYGETEGVGAAMWDAFQSEVLTQILSPDLRLMPPATELMPPVAFGSTANAPQYTPLLPPAPPDSGDLELLEDMMSVGPGGGGGSVSSSTKGIPHQTIEVEMQRLVLQRHLSSAVAKIVQNPTEQSPRSGDSSLQQLIAKNVDLKNIVAAHYLCDFGNVVLGQTRKKIFKITNASLVGQLNWVFDKKFLSGSGFSIEPEKVAKLLEAGSIDFVVKFFARLQQKVGPKICVLPIENKGSPTINIVLTANICLPEVELSSYSVDFGRLLIGRSTKAYIRLFNPAPITANWTFKKIKDDNRFSVEPSEGSLKPGKGLMVCVEFMPTDVHRYVAEFAVKIDLNKKSKSLRIVGEGFGTPLKFDPFSVELGPIIPFSSGDEKVVTVSNNSDVALEFFSLDFDRAFKEEESLLASLTDFDAQGVFRTPLREAGDALPEDVMESCRRAAKELEDAAAGGGNPSLQVAEEGEEGSAIVPVRELESAPLRTKVAPRDSDLHQDIVFVGAPLSGVSTQARLLGKKLQLAVKTFDDLVEEAALTTDELGFLARLCLGQLTEEELAPIEERKAELLATAEQSKTDVAEAFKKDKKNKGKEVPEEMLLTPEVLAHQTYVDAHRASVENLAKVVTFRLGWNDVGDGIVVDSLASTFSDPATVFQCLQMAMPRAIFSHLLINREEEGFETYISALHAAQSQESERLAKQIDSNRRMLQKTYKPPKAGSAGANKESLSEIFEDALSRGVPVPESLPAGDESWADPVKGTVLELEPHEFKALEEKEKLLYLQQLLCQQTRATLTIEQTIAKILTIWSPSGGLKTSASADEEVPVDVASGEVEAVSPDEAVTESPVSEPKTKPKTIFYADYRDSVLPLLANMPRAVYSPPSVAESTAVDQVEEADENGQSEKEPTATDSPEDATPPDAASLGVDSGLFEICLEGDETEELVFATLTSLLPPPKVPPVDKNAVPPPCSFQVFRKPAPRPNRRAMRNFEIIDLVVEAPVIAVETPVEVAPIKAAPAKKGGKNVVEEVAPPVETVVVVAPPRTRWVIEPHGTVQFVVRFKAVAEGKFESVLDFEVVGTHQRYSLVCQGVCELPHINNDTRNIFMRRVKAVNPNGPLPHKRYSIGDNFYSFGPLNLFKKPDWRKLQIDDSLSAEDRERAVSLEATHMDTLRITNNGKYKCDVDLGLDNSSEESQDVFQVEPRRLVDLEEGETRDVRVWALPREVKQYSNTLTVSIVNNPSPLLFPVKCWGVDPTLDIDGPWGEALLAAEQAVAQCTDKKLIKDVEAKLAALKESLTIDFERILIGKTDTRSFTIKNTSLLPVAWEIDAGEFLDSPYVTIEPMSGVLPINSELPIVVSFHSEEARMISGKFSFRYSDTEGGLTAVPSRVTTRSFRAVAEAYKIQAVSLTSAGLEERGSEIDFGLLRVGDYAVQTVKMGNKGKYKIGYSFKISSAAMEGLVKIEPMEGTIETGAALAEIKVTFCSKLGEVLLRGNKDIIVQISEPITGEIVEKFPLFVSAQSKYSKFRLQPSKGISFGAVRFDSEAKTKTVELRNEGNFEITYVMCPAISEHDEIDSLDAAAFGCYAFATPAAMRAPELGDEYMKRVSGGGDAGGKGKKEAKAPAKGKGAVVETNTSTLNPLVQDPDSLVLGTLPTDPLVVGAFTVGPRIGTVQPGQFVGINMKFDPSGCATVKERLRLCISGVDPKDTLSQIIKSFEITGESCVPAIVNDDVNSIFEEQEVVHSLADSTGDKSAEGGGKIEKLAVGKVVYAESEKMLAFGPVSCGQAGRGMVERIRISNPTKIDTKVKIRIVSPEIAAELAAAAKNATGAPGKDAKGKGKEAAKPAAKGGKGAVAEPEPAPSAFTIQPDRWEIPPHEHRFVNIYFNPTEIKSYRSVFIAEVDDEGVETSAQPKTAVGGNNGKQLIFDLGGSGTLPCIAFDAPTERSSDGSLLFNYSKVLVNRVSRRRIAIRNDGVMPSTCLFEMTGDSDFVFPAKGTSLTVAPGGREELFVSFAPKQVVGDGARKAAIKGSSYACDAIIDTVTRDGNEESAESGDLEAAAQNDSVTFPDINLADSGTKSSQQVITLRSKSEHPLKFRLAAAEGVPKVLSFSPEYGHLAAQGSREVTVIFATEAPIKLDNSNVVCTLNRIEYKSIAAGADDSVETDDSALWGLWDDSMKSVRPARPEDLSAIADAAAAMKDFLARSEAEKAKGKKGKPVGPPPERCLLELAPLEEDGTQNIFEIVPEPANNVVADVPAQQLTFVCSGVADNAKYTCQGDGENISLTPTFLFQSTVHKFTFTNESNLAMPLNWSFDDIKQRGNTRSALQSRVGTANYSHKLESALKIPCPFSIEPEECVVAANSKKEFTLKFLPVEVDDFMYVLKGDTLSAQSTAAVTEGDAAGSSALRMILRASAKRPICHFDVEETPDYLSRRPLNTKNENGLNSPIEVTNIRVVELESVGLRTRNTFRFHATNPTSDNYEFLWESMGDASPYWRCVQGAGMMFAGKRIEVVFEYLPEEVSVAEAFFRFRIPNLGLEQIFLFTGKVSEPKVFFSTSKIDFHSVMLGGEGGTETVYLENKEHLPFNFNFDKYSLLQLDGPAGAVLEISPKSGTVAPHGRVAITLLFHPQEEVVYNYNILCEVKRKPNKLSINIKGEGYAVHPVIQLEQSDAQAALTAGSGSGPSTKNSKYLTLRPAPATNYADFGSVQVLDTVSKTVSVTNSGKYNFDYVWDIDSLSSMLALTGGKMGGTLLKGEEVTYKITFAPQREGSLDGSIMSFTVAGKYVYNILARGSGVKPALRFSFMQYDFGPCFITSPGGSTVVEETVLRIVNHDPSSNISIECTFTKTRSLWAECSPTVIAPGGTLDVPIRFAPREVKDYAFVIPFVVNGTSKVPVNITGSGITPRLELVSGSQRRTTFGLVNVGSEASRQVALINKSKKALPVQLLESGEYGGGALTDRCVSFAPRSEFVVGPKETVMVQLIFNPTKRVSQFNEDLLVRYAGISRKLLTVSGKAQGVEISLDSDSLPFGVVVMNSQKIKKLALENTGDMSITFHWNEDTFGKHFSLSPLSGKLLPGSEVSFDVVFRPQFVDEDIRQDGIELIIPGLDPLRITCTGACMDPPSESVQTLQFNSLARKAEVKTIKFTNPTDKDWYLAPSLQGSDWKIPHEFKVPAKGAADLPVTYFPLTMSVKGVAEGHSGQLFVALPDGSAQLYKLRGTAGPPECAGQVSVETPAKKAATVILRVNNWLGDNQKLDVTVDIREKPTAATFIVAANATEIGPNGTKEFPIRFVSFVEGTSKGTITFTNSITGEYAFYELTAKTTMPEVLETVSVESPVRQTARYIITVENPLPAGDNAVTMGSVGKPADWWQCDCKYVRLNELTPLSGNSEGSFEVEYRPLMPTAQPTEHLLTVTTKELGTFKYKLIVKATPPILRQVLRFDVPLGSMQTESFIFHAYNALKCDYTNSVRRPDFFTVQKTLTVDPVAAGWDGDDVRLSVVFEPTEIGEVRDLLTVSSPGEGGEYQCELIGNCVAPMPQGPFNLVQGQGGALEIPFRNCFTTTCSWAFSVDSTAFRVVAPTASVNAKTQGVCSVVFEPKEEHLTVAGGFVNAKLFIQCSTIANTPPWTFYLRGKIDLNAPAVPSKGGKK